MLEIYAEFDSLKHCQVALRADSTNLRIIQAKAEKRKSVKVLLGLLRRFLMIFETIQKSRKFLTQRRKGAKARRILELNLEEIIILIG